MKYLLEKTKVTLPFLVMSLLVSNTWASPKPTQIKEAACPDFLNHSYEVLHSSKSVNLCTLYSGKPILLINTASHCGYTRQFKGLETLYKKYQSQGVELIGFTSNDFKQAAKSEKEAASVCYKNYGVTFTMLAPTQVKGDKANATFQHLNTQTRPPKWNFNKYLITGGGTKVQAFNSDVEPTNSKLENALKNELKQALK